ncbi:hypothetical protein OSJ77_05685 [Phyllobacterium sp. 0TCS1.6C]|jgi:hypothetical protein|uniref:hypothetical protein n=1 Tax=unclassified Phyllobacterium TaxID=2638441 RepID=UPI0022641C36|nr:MULTISPECIES: hypothetical protein [unclassified Phyllobacterium]MCX8279671.1 hypothetical protein [Phyllobacterium sp. 0TCS1.6C]MCX8292138.1 hypothetical protein [Phyllobacterium sp. 0TCS1.6A]
METNLVNPAFAHDLFVHLRVIVGIVLGLSLTRLVSGLTQFVQHPHIYKVDLLHIGWVVYLLVSIIHFWWFEFALSGIQVWTFQKYVFLIGYAMLFVFLSTLLFPENIREYGTHAQYFQDRRQWFYAILAVTFIIDPLDTMMKGPAYIQALGDEYWIKQAIYALCAIIAIFVASKTYQAVFLVIGLIYEIVWIIRVYDVL